MSNSLLVQTGKEKKIESIAINNPYTVKRKLTFHGKSVTINMGIYDAQMQEKIALKALTKKFTQIQKIGQDILESDDSTSGDALMCLDQVERLYSMIQLEYIKYVKKQTLDYFIDSLIMQRTVLENKIVYMNNIFMQQTREPEEDMESERRSGR